ncbi:LOW QUALITY PROTEIN: adhesion G-protein coupled receptor F1-like [Anableps anableps]
MQDSLSAGSEVTKEYAETEEKLGELCEGGAEGGRRGIDLEKVLEQVQHSGEPVNIKKDPAKHLRQGVTQAGTTTTAKAIKCTDPPFGIGTINSTVEAPCPSDMVGKLTAVCMEDGKYGDKEDNCVLAPIQDLLHISKEVNESTLPDFLEELENVTVNNNDAITQSPATISSVVTILNNVANRTTLLSLPLSIKSTKHILETAGILTSNGSKSSWDILNKKEKENQSNATTTKSSSSSLLKLFESVSKILVNESFSIVTCFIQLKKTMFTNSFNHSFNFSVEVDIPQAMEIDKPEASGGSQFITIMVFASMDNVLLPKDEDNSSSKVINGKVVLVQTNAKIRNLSVKFHMLNATLGNPECVFWNFTLFDGLGGWSDWGCLLLSHNNETIRCSCNHTTSFSILMSPDSFKDSNMEDITFIGVGISIGSLVICLITEALIWRKISTNTTAFLRHVSIVNIAASLLIANIWFIIGASFTDVEKKNPPACVAATFFIHFFYLAMFFWMLASALLLLYRTVFVFEGGLSKTSMLVIGFALGYATPLIIAVTTMGVTVPSNKYIRGNHVCWLNWEDSKALLAFLVPALLIIAINFIILLVVIYKMLRRRAEKNAAQAGEQHVLVVIARSLAVLTPFFGLTWSLGIGTLIAPKNREIHFAFALCNSLQGCFIWVFGTLLDKKVRSETIKSLSSQDKLMTG